MKIKLLVFIMYLLLLAGAESQAAESHSPETKRLRRGGCLLYETKGNKIELTPDGTHAKKSHKHTASLTQKEKDILADLEECPCIMKPVPCFSQGSPDKMLMPLFTGSLSKFYKKLNVANALGICLQLLEIVKNLHSGNYHKDGKPVVHLDIKPLNILFEIYRRDDGDEIKIVLIDFGAAQAIEEDQVDKKQRFLIDGNAYGTIDFCAPEAIRDASKGTKIDGAKLDIYTIGTSISWLVDFESEYFKSNTEIREELKHLFAELTCKEPEDRSTLKELEDAIAEFSNYYGIEPSNFMEGFPEIPRRYPAFEDQPSRSVTPELHMEPINWDIEEEEIPVQVSTAKTYKLDDLPLQDKANNILLDDQH